MLSMGGYLALSSKLLIAFGLVFELPIVIFFLARMGVVDYHWLARNRKFAFLAAFLTGAVLTPPDVFHKPLWLSRLSSSMKSGSGLLAFSVKTEGG